MKKLLLSLGSVAAAITPVAAVIACGDKTSKSDDVVSKLGLKLGKQDATGVVLNFPVAVGNVAAGTYYFAAADVAAGKEITVKAISTHTTDTITLKVKTGKALTATSTSTDAGDSLEGTGTSAATNYPTGTLATAATTVKGDPAKFTVTEGDITKAVDNNAGIVAAIKGDLEKNAPEALFEDSYTNKATLEKTINKVLASVDKKLSANAITLVKPTITSISNLAATAVDKDEDVDTFGLTIGKQDATGVVLSFPSAVGNVAAGTYYFAAADVAAGKEITVKAISTHTTDTITLKVKTGKALTATSTSTDAGDSLEGTGTSAATDYPTGTLATAATTVKGDPAKFTATEGDITKTLDAQIDVNTKIKNFLDAVIKTKYVSKEDLVKAIDQLLIASDKKLTQDGSSLGYAGPTITISNTLVNVETEA